ncbi:MAG TPA: hypothetical protein GXX20_09040 [Clostridiaceae bacterium]|nr:hypothetical protein [Clostridiaceae bacterium]
MLKFPPKKHILKKFIINVSMALSCICIFSLLFTWGLTKTVLNSKTHKILFLKYDIYSIIQNYIEKSVGTLEYYLESQMTQNSNLNDLLSSLLEKNTSYDLIRTNIDSLRDGFFKYINRETELLPDIFIDTSSLNLGSPLEGNNFFMGKTFLTGQAPLKIDKINLSTILHYTNRNTLWEYLLTARVVSSVIKVTPKITLLLLALILVFNILLTMEPVSILKLIRKIILYSGILHLCSAFALFALMEFYMFKYCYSPFFLNSDILKMIIPYIKNCTFPMIFFLLLIGLTFIVLNMFLPGLYKYIGICAFKYRGKLNNRFIMKKNFVKFFLTISLLIIFLYSGSTVNQIYRRLESDYLSLPLTRANKAETFVQAISDENEFIYSLSVKVICRNTGHPVQGIFVNVSDQIEIQNLSKYDNSRKTNEDGIVKFKLDKGIYKIDLLSLSFPEKYKLPPSVLVDIKNPGTISVQLELEESQEMSCFYSMK